MQSASRKRSKNSLPTVRPEISTIRLFLNINTLPLNSKNLSSLWDLSDSPEWRVSRLEILGKHGNWLPVHRKKNSNGSKPSPASVSKITGLKPHRPKT